MTPQVELTYTIDPEVYRRAITHPIVARNEHIMALRNLFAVVCTIGAVFLFDQALFLGQGLVPLGIGFVFGAGLVLAVWWKQHRALLAIHARYNEIGGEMRFAAGPEGIVSSRPGIESRISWSCVREVKRIDGAVLVEVAAARLIVPEVALPDGDGGALVAQLEEWRLAA